jgi:diguanylate cyclase (GGDEF)-like protein
MPVIDQRMRTAPAPVGPGLAAVVVAVALVFFAPAPTTAQWLLLLPGAALYAAALRVEFRRRAGSTVVTGSVVVGLLFALPAPLVPLLILVATLGSRRWSGVGDAVRSAISGWHCIGPAVVLALGSDGVARLSDWPLYVLALLAQIGGDAACVALAARWSGERPAARIGALAGTFGADALLGVLGVAGAVAGGGGIATLLFCAAPVGLLAMVDADRRVLAQRSALLDSQVQRAQSEARIDPLTGLGNRRAWHEALDRAPVSGPSGVLMLDLDNLKLTNDTFGHDVGDSLILAMGRVLTSTMPGGAAICRLGGDEFAVLLPHLRRPDQLATLADGLRAAITAHPPIAGVRLSAAVGTAATPPSASLAAAIRTADALVIAQKRMNPAARRGSALRVVGDPSGRWMPGGGVPAARRSPDPRTELL